MTKVTVITINKVEGFHRWQDAPQYVAYLRERHRHVFDIECQFEVTHDDRDIEIITQQHLVEALVRDKHGLPAEFGNMSCEAIAREIVEFYPNCVSCTVREDGMGGARVVKRGIGR